MKKKIFKISISVVLVLIVVFIAWMNITPGHYQHTCCSRYVYVTQAEIDYLGEENAYRLSCQYFYCDQNKYVNMFFYTLEKIDFYK